MRRSLTLGVGTAVLSASGAVPAFAQEEVDTVANLELMTMTLYLLVATVLVFLMHAGFAMLEVGMTRQKNAANIIGKNLATLTVGILTYYLIGYGVMYGDLFAGFIGSNGFALSGGAIHDAAAGELITREMDFAFQAMFAATAATIVSGAVAERMRFGAYLAVAAVMTAIIYPVVGAWTWGGGWLGALGFSDFAGSTIVHMTGGVAALLAAAILGPRLGKFDPKTGEARAIPGHSMPLAALGTLLLFFGWFGFNGGSVLALDGEAIGFVLVTTALSGGAGGVAALLFTRLRGGTWDVATTANGILAGLVAITAGADVVPFPMAIVVGLLAGVLVVLSVAALDRLRIDDPVGAVSVHGTCGILGTLWVAVVGDASFVTQLVGVLAVVVWVGATTGLLFGVLKAMGQLRVSELEELEGLDGHEHGGPGYPELVTGTGGDGAPGAVGSPSTAVMVSRETVEE